MADTALESFKDVQEQPKVEPLPSPELQAVKEFFSPHEKLYSSEREEMLQKASEEIIDLLKSPVTAGNETISSAINQNVPMEVIEQHQMETAEAIEALDFLNNFCAMLSQPQCELRIECSTERDAPGAIKVRGLHINVHPENDNEFLGSLNGTPVKSAQLGLVKNKGGENEKFLAYGQVNFRFRDKHEHEIQSLRVDLNTVENRVEVDAKIGGPLVAKFHKEVTSLRGDDEQQTRSNFELLRQQVVHNVIESIRNAPKGMIHRDPAMEQIISTAYSESESSLMIYRQEKYESIKNPISETFGTDPNVVWAIRKALIPKSKEGTIEYGVECDEIEKLSDEDVIAIWFLGLPFEHLSKNRVRQMVETISQNPEISKALSEAGDYLQMIKQQVVAEDWGAIEKDTVVSDALNFLKFAGKRRSDERLLELEGLAMAKDYYAQSINGSRETK